MKTLIAIFSLVLLCQASYAQDTYLDDPPLMWEYPTNIPFYEDSSIPSAYHAAISLAVTVWNTQAVTSKGVPYIGFVYDNDQNYYSYFYVGDCGLDPQQRVILASTTEYTTTVQIDETEYYYLSAMVTEITNHLGVSWYTSTSTPVTNGCYDLTSDIIHELGHWLDLADNRTWTNDVMYYELSTGQAKRNLASDDIAAVAEIYQTTGIVNTPPPMPTNFSATIIGQNVVLNWTPGVGGCLPDEMELYKNGTIIANPSTSATSYTDPNALSSLPATYKVGAVNIPRGDGCGGESDSQPVTVSTALSTISGNTGWSGAIYVNSGVTINTGCTLTIDPGTNVVFNAGHGYSLVANGELNVQGSPGLPVTFTSSLSSPSAGDWGVIALNGSYANGSSICYANIQYGTEVYSTGANNVTIQNCTITNNSGHGIYFYESTGSSAVGNTIVNSNVNHGIYALASTVNCNDNTIYKTNQNQQGAGILYSGANGNVGQNDVDYYNWGIAAIWGASPFFYNVRDDGRNNRITHCLYGLMIYEQSFPHIGDYETPPAEYYFGNSIHNNSVDVSLNADGSTVSTPDVEAVYWNGGNPNNAVIQVGSGSHVYDDIYITTDPWASIAIPSIQSPPNGGGVKKGEVLANISHSGSQSPAISSETGQSTPTDSLSPGIALLEQNNHGDARDFFMSYLSRHPDDQRAYVELYACADSETTPGIIQYFKSLPLQAAKEHNLLLSYLYLRSGDVSSAKLVNESIIDANPNTPLAIRAKLNNFYIALYAENNLSKASTILKEVERNADLSTPVEISDAKQAFTIYVDPKTAMMPNMTIGQNGDSSAAEVSMQNGLMTNYPNPFNPTTVISYNLPARGHVTLKIYDVLGREVANLVDRDEEAGVHNEQFDGNNLASGIYFYRLTAPGVNQVRKMLLMK